MIINSTINEQICTMAKKMPDRLIGIFPQENIKLSFSELERKTEEIARALLAHGISKGSHIAVWGTNTCNWFLLLLGAAKIGAVVVPINVNYKKEELLYILQQANVDILFCMQNYKNGIHIRAISDLINENKNEFPDLKHVITMDSSSIGEYSWNKFIEKHQTITEQILLEEISKVKKNDYYMIQYTSGTTSKPKGAVINQYGAINVAYSFGERIHLTENDITCCPLPFFHCFANVLVILSSIIFGSTIVVVNQFSPKNVLKYIDEEKCTTIVGVPTMFNSMLNVLESTNYNHKSLVKAILGGSVCQPALLERINKTFETTKVIVGYGLSEATCLVTISNLDDSYDKRVNTIGKAIPNIEIKIINRKTNEEINIGEEGELCIRGYNTMVEYYKDREKTLKSLDPEGWLHTGDIGSVDSEGYYRIIGRRDDMIVKGGENISPAEIEKAILKIDDVDDAQVVAAKDEKYGEEVSAFIISKKGISEEKIKNDLNGKIADYKIPKYIYFVDSYPMTLSGKVEKYKLRMTISI